VQDGRVGSDSADRSNADDSEGTGAWDQSAQPARGALLAMGYAQPDSAADLLAPTASHIRGNALRMAVLDHGGDMWVEAAAVARFLMRPPVETDKP
jgi:hypothetical protein